METRFFGRTVPYLIPLVASLLLVPANGSSQEEHRLQGDEVAVYNLAGTVEIVPGAGSDVVVEVIRGGGDAGQLEIGVREVAGREALVIRYPAERVVYPDLGRGSRTEIRVRDDGTFFGDWGLSRGDEVRIMGSGDGMEAWADLRISVPRGGDLAVYQAVGEANMRDVEGTILMDLASGNAGAQASSGELSIDTGSGTITVDGYDGDVNLDTGSGEVELRDVRGNDVMVDTGSGSVRASGIQAARFEVDTGSGEIELEGVASPDVTLDTGSGTVEVELTQDVEVLEIDTGSGDVTVWVPNSVGAQVDLDTGSGSIDLGLPLEVQEVERDHVEGVLGDGRGRIHVDTGSGRIRLMGR
ncbi:MAG: DUF4097 family beta strand repeat-containing protein [Gemmatimonadota bacterium]|jgi:hypothetical protein